MPARVKKSEMTIGLWLNKAARLARESQAALEEAEALARRAAAVHPQGPDCLQMVARLHDAADHLACDLEAAAR